MKILNQDLWSAKADLVVVTCNGCVTKDGRLVMGRGVAKEAADKFPDLPQEAGDLLQTLQPRSSNPYLYGFTVVTTSASTNAFEMIGLFQAKYHFKDKAKLSLIGYSVVQMNEWLRTLRIKSVAMNFPGIGYGGLKREEVEPLLRDLDDRVTIYIRE